MADPVVGPVTRSVRMGAKILLAGFTAPLGGMNRHAHYDGGWTWPS
jgi:hypothetical protein